MALASHFVFATDKARFACPEIKLGVFPPVLAAIGALQLGGPLAERLLLTGAEMSSDDAVACGWLTQKVPDDGALDAVLAWYREQLAPLSAFSLRQAALASRRAGGIAERLGEPLERVERQYLDELAESHDGNEGIEAFLQKRKPKWRNA
jgi:enoyl-CoA hydratase/carnithine racemase